MSFYTHIYSIRKKEDISAWVFRYKIAAQNSPIFRDFATPTRRTFTQPCAIKANLLIATDTKHEITRARADEITQLGA